MAAAAVLQRVWPQKQQQHPRPIDRRKKYAQPLPIEAFPLPAFIPSNPLSYFRILLHFLYPYLRRRNSHSKIYHGYYSPQTRSVHITDPEHIQALWCSGFFGKGSLSRSEPEWLARERKRLAVEAVHGQPNTAAEVTNQRRQARREEKRSRAQRERAELEMQLIAEGKLTKPTEHTLESVTANGSAVTTPAANGSLVTPLPAISNAGATQMASITNPADMVLEDMEHLQLNPQEALFLAYGLGTLKVHATSSSKSPSLQTQDLLHLFRRTALFPSLGSDHTTPRPDDTFMVHYAAYHHYRSLGWVVRPGIKFAVDLLLYARGPVFSHAEFAVIVLPAYSRWDTATLARYHGDDNPWRERSEWWYIHAANRVQNQVLKTLVVTYVDVPTPDVAEKAGTDMSALMKSYSVREIVVKRWTANRNRG